MGIRVPSHIAMRNPVDVAATDGRILMGAVLVTRVLDSDRRIGTSKAGSAGSTTGYRAVYCDVLVYDYSLPGPDIIRECLVLQERGAIHENELWYPRESSLAVNGAAFDSASLRDLNPAMLDGEHVAVGFFGNSYKRPYILKGVPHPMMDLHSDGAGLGRRLLARRAELYPRLGRHRGVVWGVTADGNVTLNTVDAYDSKVNVQADGSEPPATADGTSGAVNIQLQRGTTNILQLDALSLTLTNSDNSLILDVPSSAASSLLKASVKRVELGIDADEPVHRATSYDREHNTMESAVKAALLAQQAAIEQILVALDAVTPTIALTAALGPLTSLVAASAAATTAAGSAIDAFPGNVLSFATSPTVLVK